MEPGVLLLDEAATDLDPAGRRDLYATLQRLRGGRLTMLAVEHEIDPVMSADQLVLMRHGEIVARGRPDQLARDPAIFLRCGVRPHDLALLATRLDLDDLPLDLDGAIERLRARGVAGAAAAVPDAGARGRPILEVERLTCSYGATIPVLEGVQLRIGAGEFIALIGQNGSGKTTLAKHLNGLLRPEGGTVRLDGVDLATLPLERVAPEVGYVFQNPDHQLFAATVGDEVAFGPRNFGLAGAELEQRVRDTLAAVDLLALRDEDPFLLNKGERQRLAVATVLALAPRVLILDEPTTGLDYPQQRRMLELLARLRAAGTTVVVITHSPWVVVEYAERALLMGEGRLLFDGPLATVLGDEGLLAAAAFEPPPIARLARALGVPGCSVDAVARALGGGGD
jgi:energy-coupling factor transport system ATP-binding protein